MSGQAWTPTTDAIAIALRFRETNDAALLPVLGDAIADGDGPEEWTERARGWKCGCDKGSIDTGGETPWGAPISEACPHCEGVGNIPPSPAVASMVLAMAGSTCDCRVIDGKRMQYVFAGPESHWEDCAKCIGTGKIIDIYESLRAVCEAREAREWDTPRLLLADLIEPSDKELAEFVRVQCELAAPMKADWIPSEDMMERYPLDQLKILYDINNWRPAARASDLRRREREMFELNAARWLNFPGYAVAGFRNGCEAVLAGPVESMSVRLRRGLVAEITCTWADWLRIEPIYWHPEQRERCGWCQGTGNAPWRSEDRKRFNDQARAELRKRQTRLERGESDSIFEHRVLVRGGELHMAWINGGCTSCHGTGTVPRPFPATACPLELVRITGMSEGIPSNRHLFDTDYRWPGLQFKFIDASAAVGGVRDDSRNWG